MIGLVALVVFLPLLGAVAVAFGARTRASSLAMLVGAIGSFLSALVLSERIMVLGHFEAIGGFVYVDSLSAFFTITVSLVIVLASFASISYVRAEEERDEFSMLQVRLYFVFFAIFSSGMLAAFLAGNLGLLWVLIEASTLASAALVGLEARPRSLEAAWKYVIVSSFGVTIALLSTLFLFYAGSALVLTSSQRLTWPYLFIHAQLLTPASVRLAFLLAVIGYGTKVGLAPMHTWLPDAHSEAPSPASAMLSAALLNTGMYAIIRFQAIAKLAIGRAFPDDVLLIFGFLSIMVGVLFMVRRGNFKRLFAYSSIEHMGIIAVALGFGGILGLYGALLQILNHALGKTVLFLSSGDLVLGYRTREVNGVRGVLSTMPFIGGVLLLASLAVAGTPPFGIFLSELTIVRAGFATTPLLGGLVLFLLVIGFVALIGSTIAMTTGEGPPVPIVYSKRSERVLSRLPLVGGLLLLGILGLWIPSGLNQLILHAVRAIT